MNKLRLTGWPLDILSKNEKPFHELSLVVVVIWEQEKHLLYVSMLQSSLQ